jgi:hypothetical protein
LITSNAFYVVLTPSTHGDFIAYVSLLGSYGVWTRFASTFVVGMFSKHGTYVILKKSKMWKCEVESSKTFMMYMSINHGETIDDFKERGRVDVRESLHKHRPGDAWTNYFWTYYHQFGK